MTITEALILRNASETVSSAELRLENRIHRLIAEYVVPRLPIAHSVLEFGKTDPLWTTMLIDHYPKVTTVNASQQYLDNTKRQLKNPRWRPVCSSFAEYQPHEKVDMVLITCMEQLEDHRRILSMVRQHWLREGGHLAVVAPHALSLHRRLSVKMGERLHPAQQIDREQYGGRTSAFMVHELARDLVLTDFAMVKTEGLFCQSQPSASMADLPDVALRGLFDLGRELPMEYAHSIFLHAVTR